MYHRFLERDRPTRYTMSLSHEYVRLTQNKSRLAFDPQWHRDEQGNMREGPGRYVMPSGTHRLMRYPERIKARVERRGDKIVVELEEIPF